MIRFTDELRDRDLEQRVKFFLAGHNLPALRRLAVAARDGTVTLSGQVPTFYAKQLSQQCRRRVAGVRHVVDRVVVDRPGVRDFRRWLSACAIALSALLPLTGCGRSAPNQVPVFPAQGTVIVNGKPAAGAVVVLHPKDGASAPAARAEVQPDGTFFATTYAPRDGAAEGDYVVTVEWYRPREKNGEFIFGPNLVPPKYSRPETSKIEVHVASQANHFPPITIKR